MILLLPVGLEYRTQRFPVVTFTLIGLNTLAYLASLIYFLQGGETAEEWLYQNFWLIPAQSSWHTYLTTLFVHAGFFHLLGNMMYLFLFGSCVEDRLGRWQFTLFYLLGGLAADFGHIAASPDHFASELPLGGASGAVTACIAGFVLLMHKTKINFRYLIFLFFRFWTGEFALPAWLVISFWFLKDLLFAVLSFMNETAGGGVAFAAHVGGFLGGLAMVGGFKLWWRVRGEGGGADPVMASPVRVAAPARPEHATIYLLVGGAQTGPFTATQVSQMLALGSVGGDAFYWEDGMPEWRSVMEFGDRMQ